MVAVVKIKFVSMFQPMVRPGFTNYFQTKNVEDLENRISYVLTEQVRPIKKILTSTYV
jgi:hypothetical protein